MTGSISRRPPSNEPNALLQKLNHLHPIPSNGPRLPSASASSDSAPPPPGPNPLICLIFSPPPNTTITGVCNSALASSTEAIETHSLTSTARPHASPTDLAASSDVDLVVRAKHTFAINMSVGHVKLRLQDFASGVVKEIEIQDDQPGPVGNVGRLYEAFADGKKVPDWKDAVRVGRGSRICSDGPRGEDCQGCINPVRPRQNFSGDAKLTDDPSYPKPLNARFGPELGFT